MMNRKDKIVSAVGAPPPPRAPTVVETPELADSANVLGDSTRTTFRRMTTTVRRSRTITRPSTAPTLRVFLCDTGALTLGHDDFASAHDRNTPVLSTISQRRRATMTT
jgi:hypothetical protein